MTGGGTSLTAACTLSYKTTGTHLITAACSGDANFTASGSSPPAQVTLVPAPVRVLGTITSTRQWSFHYTPTYTTVRQLVVNGAPLGATVVQECRGRGCPFTKRVKAVTTRKPINLMLSFRKRLLRVGAQITVELTQPGWIGKDYRFAIRARRAPRIQIACLAPGGTRPNVAC
jgi:hypothetical protein